MINLENINIEEFKKVCYSDYNKLFPMNERKPYKVLLETYNKKILKIIKIKNDNEYVGFIMLNILDDAKYVLLDYLAILPKYQGMGYGTQAIKILEDKIAKLKRYSGIYAEVEKVDNNSKNKKDLLKLNRRKFYKRLGFRDLNCELYLFGVSYMPCVLDITNEELNEELVMQEIFKIYSSVIGKYTNKFCKVKYM